jgi:hypothetical protein
VSAPSVPVACPALWLLCGCECAGLLHSQPFVAAHGSLQ